MDWNGFSLHFGSLHICNQWSLIASIGVYSMSVIVAGQLMDLSNVIISNVFYVLFRALLIWFCAKTGSSEQLKKKQTLTQDTWKKKKEGWKKGKYYLVFFTAKHGLICSGGGKPCSTKTPQYGGFHSILSPQQGISLMSSSSPLEAVLISVWCLYL